MVDKKGLVNSVGALILVLIVFAVIVLGMTTGIFGGFGSISPFAQQENTFEVVNHCGVVCLDRNSTQYCIESQKPLPLRLGNGKVVKGSCGSIQEVGIHGFDGIPSCRYIKCSEPPAAVCLDNGREVDCSEFAREGFLES
jgi:hypothetical protein